MNSGKPLRVLDVGCGPGIYVEALQRAGMDATGIDPDPNSPYEKVSIFSPEFAKYTNYDLCICLEVAEHIDEALADEFVQQLVKTAPTILFSAALPGQGGHGHINCQPKEYWAHKFARQNYVLDTDAVTRLTNFMRDGYHMGWFINNVQVFRQYGAVCFDRIRQEETPQAERLATYICAGLLP